VGSVESFERDFLPRFIEAQRAFHTGDPDPNIALWVSADPISIFAVSGRRRSGLQDVLAAFRDASSWFSDLQHYEWESVVTVVADDLAYTVSIERFAASVRGAPVQELEFRSTHVFRLEDGRWRAAHRHADRQPSSD